MDVFRCNVFQVQLVDPGALFHVEGHSGRRNDIVDGIFRMGKKLACIAGSPGKLVPRRVFLPHVVGLFDPLFHLKKPGPSRNPICLQRRGNRKTDRLRCTGRIRHHQIRHHRIQPPPGTFHGCIKGFQIDAQISAVLQICFIFFQIYISIIFIIIHVHKKESPLPPVSLSLIIIHFAGQKKGRICGILNFQHY